MIIVDLNQVMIANLMTHLAKNMTVDENLLRHMILNTIRSNRVKFHKDYGELVIACDDRNYWRKKVFPYYKASRKKTREDSGLDWNLIFKSLNAIRDELKEYFPYRVIQVESAEADDIIGTLCNRFGKPLGGDPILILSGDKDFQQLQVHANVSQYDPTRKRWITCRDPHEFLVEHILRGDTSDGVPNFLSSDDTFVSNSRQRQLRQKVVDEILSVEWPQEWSGMSEELLRNFYRNKKMIDLSEIPEEIMNEVNNQYDSQTEGDRSMLFNYFIKKKLKNLVENIGEF